MMLRKLFVVVLMAVATLAGTGICLHAQTDPGVTQQRPVHVITAPRFPGDSSALIAHISRNMKFESYPKDRITRDTVQVSFLVAKDGVPSEFVTMPYSAKRTHCDSAAINAAKQLPVFTPGTCDGRAIAMYVSILMYINVTPTSAFTLDSSNTDIVYESMPAYNSGAEAGFQQYVATSVVYPDSALDAEQQGTVYVQFRVDSTGKVQDVKVVRGVKGATSLSSEAVRVIAAMPDWIPATRNGKPIGMIMTIPVRFVLTDEDIKRHRKEKKQQKKKSK